MSSFFNKLVLCTLVLGIPGSLFALRNVDWQNPALLGSQRMFASGYKAVFKKNTRINAVRGGYPSIPELPSLDKKQYRIASANLSPIGAEPWKRISNSIGKFAQGVYQYKAIIIPSVAFGACLGGTVVWFVMRKKEDNLNRQRLDEKALYKKIKNLRRGRSGGVELPTDSESHDESDDTESGSDTGSSDSGVDD